jgi:hypothetical protein
MRSWSVEECHLHSAAYVGDVCPIKHSIVFSFANQGQAGLLGVMSAFFVSVRERVHSQSRVNLFVNVTMLRMNKLPFLVSIRLPFPGRISPICVNDEYLV